jgi:hypothetical protein
MSLIARKRVELERKLCGLNDEFARWRVGQPTLKSCSRGRAPATARQFAARRGARRCRRHGAHFPCEMARKSAICTASESFIWPLPFIMRDTAAGAREIGLGRVDPLQRPVKETVYNASLVNCHIDKDATNGNMPVSGACNGSSWAPAGFVPELAIIAFYN